MDKHKCALSFIKQSQAIPVYQLFTLEVCHLANVKRLISGMGSRGRIERPKVSVVSHLLLNKRNVFRSCFKPCVCGVCYLKDLPNSKTQVDMYALTILLL